MPALVRALIVHALKTALAREGTRAATTGGSATIAAFRPARRAGAAAVLLAAHRRRRRFAEAHARRAVGFAEAAQVAFDTGVPAADLRVER